jgi:hypothetical protein
LFLSQGLSNFAQEGLKLMKPLSLHPKYLGLQAYTTTPSWDFLLLLQEISDFALKVFKWLDKTKAQPYDRVRCSALKVYDLNVTSKNTFIATSRLIFDQTIGYHSLARLTQKLVITLNELHLQPFGSLAAYGSLFLATHAYWQFCDLSGCKAPLLHPLPVQILSVFSNTQLQLYSDGDFPDFSESHASLSRTPESSVVHNTEPAFDRSHTTSTSLIFQLHF